MLHRAAYAELGLDWAYEAIDCGEQELPGVLRDRADWAGFSCTMPLKRAALELADEVAPTAVQVGAANTLLPRRGGGWVADNTDVTGITAALSEAGCTTVHDVTVIGAGGTAQAAVVAVARTGATDCTVLVRDERRAGDVRAAAARGGIAVRICPYEPGQRALEADLVISTVPAGAADAVADRRWSSSQLVLDVVYSPWPTRLAAAVEAAGATAVSGALMLLHQAAEQVRLMTGFPAPVPAMRAALAAAAPGCGV